MCTLKAGIRSIALVLVAFLGACNTSTIEEGSAEAPTAVCSHHYNEPVLNLAYVMDALSGAMQKSVSLLSLTINGRLVTSTNYPLALSSNIQAVGDRLVCTLPCGLGTEEGAYQLMIEAPGYMPQTINVTANYRVFAGGCPSMSDQGLHIGINLEAPRE